MYKKVKILVSIIAVVSYLVSGVLMPVSAQSNDKAQGVSEDGADEGWQIKNLFPDDALANVIAEELGKTIETVVDQEQLDQIDSLTANDRDIVSLQGLSYLRNISHLDVSQNKITDINSFWEFEKLTSLNLSHNQIKDISPLENIGYVQLLDLSHNNIEDSSPLYNIVEILAAKKEVHHILLEHQMIYLAETKFVKQYVTTPSVLPITGALQTPEHISNISHSGEKNNTEITWNLESYVESVHYDVSSKIGGTSANKELGDEQASYATYHATVIQTFSNVPEHTMSFDVNGGESPSPKTQQVFLETPAENPSEAFKKNHRFIGWNSAQDGNGKMWNFATDLMPDHDVKLYAQYSTNTYKVLFTYDGGTEEQAVDSNELIPAPTFGVVEDNQLVGWIWYNNGEKRVWDFAKDLMPEHDLELHAEYTKQKHKVVFANGGQITEQLVTYGSLISPVVPKVKEQYKFIGWAYGSSDHQIWNFEKDWMPDYNLTLSAKYEKEQYKVSFISEKNTTEQLAIYDKLIEPIAPPIKDGCTFLGWNTVQYEGGKMWDFTQDIMPEWDMKLYAKYSPNTYKVLFKNEGETFEQDKIYNELIEEKEAVSKEGHTFKGWNTQEDGRGYIWTFNYDRMPANDLTLYADYYRNSHRIRFFYEDYHETFRGDHGYYDDLLIPHYDVNNIHGLIGWNTKKMVVVRCGILPKIVCLTKKLICTHNMHQMCVESYWFILLIILIQQKICAFYQEHY